MKKFLTITIICFVFSSAAAQTGCSKYYPFKEGTKAEITTYDKKGKMTATVDYTILKRKQTADGEIATIQSSVKDNKGKLLAETKYDATCDGNKISIDFHSMVSPMMLEQFENMEYDISGTDLEIPNNLSVGQSLPDASMKMNINMGGIKMAMETLTANRKVIGKESITTPVGTFNCFVITSDMTVKMGAEITSSMKQWIAEGVGMVKQEDSKNGKITSSSMLTKFSN